MNFTIGTCGEISSRFFGVISNFGFKPDHQATIYGRVTFTGDLTSFIHRFNYALIASNLPPIAPHELPFNPMDMPIAVGEKAMIAARAAHTVSQINAKINDSLIAVTLINNLIDPEHIEGLSKQLKLRMITPELFEFSVRNPGLAEFLEIPKSTTDEPEVKPDAIAIIGDKQEQSDNATTFKILGSLEDILAALNSRIEALGYEQLKIDSSKFPKIDLVGKAARSRG
jgi:hypothetical protein